MTKSYLYLGKIENRKITQAMNLFRRLVDDFPWDGFTLNDVTESYNAVGTFGGYEPSVRNRYGKSHLHTLVVLGLLEHDRKTGIYRINDSSPRVMKSHIATHDFEEIDMSDIREYIREHT